MVVILKLYLVVRQFMDSKSPTGTILVIIVPLSLSWSCRVSRYGDGMGASYWTIICVR